MADNWRNDSPVTAVDWALRGIENDMTTNPDTDGVDVTITDDGQEHLHYRTTGTVPWTELANQTDLTTLQTTVSALTGDSARITTLETRTTALSGSQAVQSSRLTTLEQTTTALTGTTAGLSTRVTALELTTLAITGGAATLTSRTTTLESRINAITGVDSNQDGRITTLETLSRAMTGVDATLTSRTTALEVVTTAFTGVNTVQDTRLAVLESRTIALTGVDAGYATRLAFLETQLIGITGYGARLTAEEARTFRSGSFQVPVLLLGATSDIAFTWRNGAGTATPFPNANYRVEFEPNPTLSLGTNVTFAVVGGTQTANGMTVRVTAVVAIAVATWCNVNGFSN